VKNYSDSVFDACKGGMPVCLVLALVFQVLLLSACASLHPEELPAVVKEKAHSGGSVVAFSQSGDLLASGGWEGTVRLWQLPQGREVRHWLAHSDSVNGIAFLKSDREIVTAGYDGLLTRRAIDGQLLEQVRTPSAVTHMVADIKTDRLLTGHDDGTVRLWKAADFTLLKEQQLHQGAVKAVAIDPGVARYASSSTDGTVVLWSEDAMPRQLATPPADAWTLAFSPDGKTLSGGSWFRLYQWDLDDGRLTTIATEHRGIIKSIEYINDGNELATISRQTDSSVYFLDAESGEVRRRFQRHDLCGGDIAVSQDGRYLATTSDDASVRFWLLDSDGEVIQ
jgi:WD40 repeat protein